MRPILLLVSLLAFPVPGSSLAAQPWDVQVEEVRRVTAGMLAAVEEMPGPHGSSEARDRWERFSRAVGLEAARGWAVMARFGYEPPGVEGLDWSRGRGVEQRFVRRMGPWERAELRILAGRAFDDLVDYMEGLDAEARARVDRRSGLTQGEWLGGLAVTFAAKLQVLEDWVRRSGGPRAPS